MGLFLLLVLLRDAASSERLRLLFLIEIDGVVLNCSFKSLDAEIDVTLGLGIVLGLESLKLFAFNHFYLIELDRPYFVGVDLIWDFLICSIQFFVGP